MLDKIKNLFKKKSINIPTGILDYSTDVVGYPNREIQYKTYARINNIIPVEDSILDFGCGRGDFYNWLKGIPGHENKDYIGIDKDKKLTQSGNKLYKGISLIESNWNSLSNTVKSDWCININSMNYDYGQSKDKKKNLQRTIKKMFNHADKGVILLLASELVLNDLPWIQYNPGETLNWAREEYGNVAIDHSSFMNSFILVIYKKK
jgi:hypothetical protein